MVDGSSPSDPGAEQQQANTEMPGSMLRDARNEAGFSTEDIAGQLNLSVAKLQALEEDRYDKLASPVFAQGYLRRYAKLVNVDADVVVQRYRELQGLDEAEDEAEPPRASGAAQMPKWLLPAVILVLAVLVLGFVLLRASDDAAGPVTEGQSRPGPGALQRDVPGMSDAAQSPAEQEEIPQEPAPLPSQATTEPAPQSDEAEPSAQSREQLEPQASLAQPNAAQNVAPSPQSSEAQAQLPQAEALPPPNSDNVQPVADGEQEVLAFAFSGECWVEVRDASGRVIHADLAREGQSFSIQGQAPFSVMLGNASAVSLSHNGEIVPVSPRPGNRTARLQVGG